ncbi:sigma-54-dependent transcriptional regulator [Alkalimarinus sediminis]|uniref:Sigma-54 dependent transcriptional regulator n=1 Tax=Alkalimarinus sediminis TaxID=1632866 RepID=A0A9E8KKC1_9ALTE|nr:sigma-54 dependent transcriptional regulator [Alkalimarinus sediminis]UZW75966.1 sigma-54 dependent transcriptional regulator [Alkalimarinus sediminis]
MKKRILLVEDSPSLASVYESYLEQEDFLIITVGTGKEALIQISREPPEVILLDLKLPDMDGMDILKKIHQEQIPSNVIIITAHGSIDIAVNAMQFGSFDFLVKPFDAKRLKITVNNALKNLALTQEVATMRESFDRNHYEGFIGESLAMQGVYRIIDSAAMSNATIFITGESGTGKEVCANAVHNRSPRKSNAFIALNCGAIPKDLMESEIFGHVKGAFTGAQSNRDGAATQAHKGTLFLDEICEMDLDLQTKLLRFIQTGTFQPVGGSQLETVDVRFVCATNKDPWKEVQEGRFREDLYYRLHVIPIQLPPLRDRETDVKLLIDRLLAQYSEEENKSFTQFSPDAIRAMMDHNWPGNVRELQNVIRNIVVLNTGSEVTLEMIPPPVNMGTFAPVTTKPIAPETTSAQPATSESATVDDSSTITPLWKVEKDAIERAIDMCDGNIPKAAALLDVSASTIYRKKERWES